jgi:hypothetical protein
MNPEYFVARIPVRFEVGKMDLTGDRIQIEVEAESAEIDPRSREFRSAVLNAAEWERHVSKGEWISINDMVVYRTSDKMPKTWQTPVKTLMKGVRIWGVQLQRMIPPRPEN